jgi:hypothetical protein
MASPSGNPTQPPPSAAPAARVRPKNAAGNKSDIAWQYAISIDEGKRRVMCKLCKHSFQELLLELSIIWLELIKMLRFVHTVRQSLGNKCWTLLMAYK